MTFWRWLYLAALWGLIVIGGYPPAWARWILGPLTIVVMVDWELDLRCRDCNAPAGRWSEEHKGSRWGDRRWCWTCGAARAPWWLRAPRWLLNTPARARGWLWFQKVRRR